MTDFYFMGGLGPINDYWYIFNKDSTQEDSLHTLIGIQNKNEDSTSHFIDWSVRGWYSKNNHLFLIGEDGEYIKIKDKKIIHEGNLNCGKSIFTGAANLSVGCLSWGMNSTLCIQDKNFQWNNFNQGLEQLGVDIYAIDSNLNRQCYLVGLNGAIYELKESKWNELSSPTNSHLNDCLVLNSGETYICGNEGTLLYINHDYIDIIKHDFISENFWGLYQHKDMVFLISSNTVFKIIKGKLIPYYGWDPAIDGIYTSVMDTPKGFWVFSENKIHIFENGIWK